MDEKFYCDLNEIKIQGWLYGGKEGGGLLGNFTDSAQYQFVRESTEYPTVLLAHTRHPNHTTDASTLSRAIYYMAC